jgi:hypothetical protein
MKILATLARSLHAAAAMLERFDARRAEIEAFRLMARRSPAVASALVAACAGDVRDAVDTWAQVRAMPSAADASAEIHDETAAARRWAAEVELTRALRFALRRYSPTEPPALA